jgi:hypothetical protein
MRAAPRTKAVLIIALALAGELAGVDLNAAAGSLQASSGITIHVSDYAKVDGETLKEAEKVAAGIFREVGVEIRWVDIDLTLEGEREKYASDEVSSLSHIQLSIFPREMAQRSDVPANAMGLAPGSGTDRHLIYVFYNRVEAASQRQFRARMDKKTDMIASKSKILGCAIAHELGHVLLNLEIHSATGIMRGGWDKKDLMDIAFGSLSFTSQQAEVIRAEALRRNIRQEPVVGDRIESPVPSGRF